MIFYSSVNLLISLENQPLQRNQNKQNDVPSQETELKELIPASASIKHEISLESTPHNIKLYPDIAESQNDFTYRE